MEDVFEVRGGMEDKCRLCDPGPVDGGINIGLCAGGWARNVKDSRFSGNVQRCWSFSKKSYSKHWQNLAVKKGLGKRHPQSGQKGSPGVELHVLHQDEA